MEQIKDLRPLKSQLRKEAKAERRAMTAEDKLSKDIKIKNKLLNLWAVREADAVLLYVSSPIEVDTIMLIKELLNNNHKVCVPRCEGNDGEMNFYYIESLDDLEIGSYGILEPKKEITSSINIKNSENMTCIVPGLLFDKKGYRLGYGKGYYDRFLGKFKGKTMGICYHSNLKDEIIRGKYDRTVSMVITEREIYTV